MAHSTDLPPALEAFITATDTVIQRKRELDARLAEIEPAMNAAIARNQGPLIDVQRALLEAEDTEIEELLEQIRLVANDLHQLTKDKVIVARFRSVLGQSARLISDARDDLAWSHKRCDRLLEDAETGLKRSLQTEEAALRGLAQLQRLQRLDEESLVKTLAQARLIVGKAHEAVAARDTTLLEQQRAALDRLPIRIQRDNLALCRTRIERWCKAMLGKGLGADVDSSLLEEAQQLSDRLRTLEADDLVALERLVRTMSTLQVPAFDARKAAQVLGLDAGQAARLGKAIERAPAALEKALDSFLREQKSGLVGKTAIGLLRKARLL
jgi:hypothetical protein